MDPTNYLSAPPSQLPGNHAPALCFHRFAHVDNASKPLPPHKPRGLRGWLHPLSTVWTRVMHAPRARGASLLRTDQLLVAQ